MLAAAQNNLNVYHYAARKIKQSVSGYGGADKQQVQNMVKYLLNLDGLPGPDAADGLAIAISHANLRQSMGEQL